MRGGKNEYIVERGKFVSEVIKVGREGIRVKVCINRERVSEDKN
jgi:hypothetical protein